MQSGSSFGLTVWGFDRFVSYAYPAGASVKPVNDVVVPVVPGRLLDGSARTSRPPGARSSFWLYYSA
jgi:hypothetical protein